MANTVAYSYDPQDVLLTIGGISIEDFGSDTVVTVTPNVDRVTPQVGILGDVTVNSMRDLTGTLTLVLKAQSEDDQLMEYLQSLSGVKSFPLTLTIPSANKTLVTECWYQSQADLAVGTQIDDRSHVLGVANSRMSPLDTANNILGQIQQISL